jgi:ribosomal protein S18 acetylase RimI-like enzyme
MDASIRQATLQDLEDLVPLFDGYRQFYGRTSDVVSAREFLRARISRGESLVLMARDSTGVALGFVQLYPSFSSVRVAPIFVLNDLFVLPSARRKGLGAQLLRAAADVARSAGAVRLKLSTAITNLPAQRLYEALGWKRDEEFYEYGLSLG